MGKFLDLFQIEVKIGQNINLIDDQCVASSLTKRRINATSFLSAYLKFTSESILFTSKNFGLSNLIFLKLLYYHLLLFLKIQCIIIIYKSTCVNEIGDLIKPHYVTESFPKLLKAKGMRQIRYHDLRHSCASLLLANGVPMKQIQEWLGHSDFSTTANIYAHLDYSSKLTSADAMLNGLGLAPN